MRRRRSVAWGLAVLVLGMLGACGGGGGNKDGQQEVLLGTMPFSISDAGNFLTSGFMATLHSADAEATIFLATPVLLGGEVGIPFETAAGERADSDAYFAALTDGVDEATHTGLLELPGAGTTSNSGLESVRIQRLVPELAGPDLAGATITRLVLTFATVDIVTGNPYSVNLEGTVMFFGTVLEP